MSQWSVLEANGLHTTANPLSAVPRGAMHKAENVVIRAKDCIEPRRGQPKRAYEFANPYYRANEIFHWGERYDTWAASAVLHVDESRLVWDNGNTFPGTNFTEYTGSYEPPDADLLRMKFASYDNRLHFTTSVGPKALDGINDTTARVMGIGKPFNVETLTDVFDFGDATRNWLEEDSSVAIRVLFCRKNGDEGITLGPPSERAVVTNNDAGSVVRSVRVVAGIPAGVVATDFIRIYMTDTVGEDEEPDDECYLIHEAQLTAAQISAAQVTKDITNIEAVLSNVPLYTNPNTGDGIEASRLPPPWAKDICRWGGRLFAFNLKRKQEFRLTLLGTAADGEGTGLYHLVENRVTLNGKSYNFGDEGIPTGTIEDGAYWIGFTADGTPETTAAVAKAFVTAINAHDPDLRAYYVAKPDGWPGEIVIEETAIGGGAFGESGLFSIIGDEHSAEAFSPSLVETQYSADGVQEHGFACSEVDGPESWPLFNYGTAGNKGSAILRGIALRDGIYCLMSDGSVQVISGSAPPFRVDELDSTAKLIGPDTAQVLNNQIWALTSQGVATIGEAGVGIIGLPIEADIRALFGSVLATVKQRAFAFAYETERTYGLWLPERAGQTYCSRGFLYNYATKAWASWPLERTCGRVDPLRDVLHMGDANAATTCVERKTLTAEDLADDEWEITIVSASGTTLTVDSTTGISEGDVVKQGLVSAVVTTVTDATHLEVNVDGDAETVTWEAGAATVYEGFECDVWWVPTALGSPGLLKNISDFTLHFWELACQKAEAWLGTDLSFAWSRTKAMQRQGYGTQEWGEAPFGDPAGPLNERMGVAGQKHSASFIMPRFTIREAFAPWKLLGYTLEHEPTSERTKR